MENLEEWIREERILCRFTPPHPYNVNGPIEKWLVYDVYKCKILGENLLYKLRPGQNTNGDDTK